VVQVWQLIKPDTISSMEKTPRSHAESREGYGLSFRRATPEDADAYMELERTVLGDKKYSRSADKNEVLQEFSENEVYLVRKGEQLVGSVEFQMKDPDTAYISGLIVHPDFQGTRVAYEAVQLLMERLQGVKRIELVTHPENRKILSMSEKMGFKVVQRLENHFGDGEPRVLLVREI
jgi:[ribosomal protein S18]-alanine N-acetyltransferase